MTHLRYLRYVLLHKLYVFVAGLAIERVLREQGITRNRLAWVWRLLVHDLSKLRPSEWRPYARFFYGPPPPEGTAVGAVRRARFNYAWLLHQHRNPHHWQHWLLREDSGKTLVLIPPAYVVDEMVADWIGAGQKILARPTLAECVAATIVWYMNNRAVLQLREYARERAEHVLHALAMQYGLVDMAFEVRQANHRRTIEVAR